jgi:undecaprenyl-diphosphatase
MWVIIDKATGILGSLALAGLGLKFLAKETFRRIAVTLAAMGLFWLAGEMIKLGIAIPRPCWNPGTPASVACPETFSFPSGHVLAAAMAAMIVGLTATKSVGKRWVWIVGGIWVIFVAATRLMTGIHTWVDVLGGLVLGAVFGFLVWKEYYRNKE